jgi:hypothetical protein
MVLCIGSSFDVASLRQAMAKAGKMIPDNDFRGYEP